MTRVYTSETSDPIAPDATVCQAVREWINTHTTALDGADPPAHLNEHVATCAVCQAALLTMLTDLAPPDTCPTTVSVETSEQDLAAYIDLELELGTQIAIREFPHVWWHIWRSLEFAELYQSTRMLAETELAGIIPPLVLEEDQITHVLLAFSLDGTQLDQWFALPDTTGPPHGPPPPEHGTILSCEQIANHLITFRLHYRPATYEYSLHVTTDPSVRGWIVLKRGNTIVRAQFDRDGTVLIPASTIAMLRQITATDMHVRIEVEAEAAMMF